MKTEKIEEKKMSCIWQFMYRDVLQPGDTFPMMMRKMVMAMCAFIGIIPMIIIIQKLMGLTHPLILATSCLWSY